MSRLRRAWADLITRLGPGPICPACRLRVRAAFTCAVELRAGVSQYGQDCPDDPEYAALVDELPGRCWQCLVVLGCPHHVGCGIAACLWCDGEQRAYCGHDDGRPPPVVPLC